MLYVFSVLPALQDFIKQLNTIIAIMVECFRSGVIMILKKTK